MQLLRFLMLFVSLTLITPSFSDEANSVSCPDTKNLYFYPLIANFAGYWGGIASDGTPLQSGNYIIPYQVQNNGFDIKFQESQMNLQGIHCSYYLVDRVTGIKSPIFTLIPSNKH